MSNTGGSPSPLQLFVQRARRLYTLPAVAVKVLELTQRSDTDAGRLKECVETDPALTATIMRVVNSSLFGPARQVTDLNQALSMLGVKPLKLLVLGFSLPRNLVSEMETTVLARYWRYSLTKAVAGRELSQQCWRTAGDEAFIAGLLQDIGMLALIQDLGEPYVRFLEYVCREGGDLAALETDTLGFDHVILSARLLDHWGLPKPIVRAVAATHDADRLATLPPAERPLSQALHLADLIAQLLTRGRAEALHALQDAGARYCGLGGEQISALTRTLDGKVEQLADALAVPLAEQEADYLQLLMEAHAHLAEAAEDAAACLASRPRLATPAERRTAPGKGAGERAATPATAEVHGSHARPTALSAGPSGPAAATAEAADDPGLAGRVGLAVNNCRRARCAVSLMLLEIDGYDGLILAVGPDRAVCLMRQLRTVIDSLLESGNGCVPTGDAGFALILEDCDRQQGVEAARRLLEGIQDWFGGARESGGRLITLSAGVATLSLPPRNFPSQDLIEAAERCLYGARASGGDAVKSIMI